MARLAAARCPHCGAAVRLDPKLDVVSCSYCGTSSFVQRLPAQTPPSNMAVIVAPPPASLPVARIATVGALFLCAAGVALYLVVPDERTGPPVRPSAVTPSAGPAAVPEPSASRTTAVRIEGHRRPMLADVNADGTEDVVNLITSRDSGAASRRYAAFDGRTGRLLWQTPDQGAEASSLRAAITGGRLLLSSREGQLTAFDAARGEQHWTSALGDRVRSFCVGDKADTVRVVTVDERALSIDVKTGRQTSARGRHCEPVVTDEDAVGHKPRDRSDPRAPRGVASIYCGGVRVMGDENYVIPDQCKAKARIDPEGLEGMSAHALWKHGPGYIVIGSRRPGTPTPVVGYVHGTKLSWRADVPEGNPLDADDGAPDQVTLSGERLVVAYRNRKTQKAAVTAFAVATGERLWHRVLADTTRLARLVASRDTVFLYADSTVSALSASTGEPQFTLGENHP